MDKLVLITTNTTQFSQELNVRKVGKSYHPTIWGDFFINSTTPLVKQLSKSWMEQRRDELKNKVRSMINDTSDFMQTMQIIDAVQLLGLDYHFNDEINHALSNRVLNKDVTNCSLYEVALHFRLLRQHGHHTPSSVFNKFKDENGNFIGTLKSDPRGLLSLYNAAYLGTHGETILDEAICFTKAQLSRIESELEEPLRKQVSLVLETPLFRGMKRLMARQYISIYEEEETHNETILELAKLDFNLVQSFHQQELKDISLWWKDLELVRDLKFARDRLIECYFWALGVYYQPQYSLARIIITKVIYLASILDDIYDEYSTLEESRLLTQAIQRWDMKAIDELPEYLKDYFSKFISTFQHIEDTLPKHHKYRIFYLRDAMKTLSRAYFQESEWSNDHYVPKLEDYQITLMSSGYPMLNCASLVGLGELATMEVFNWSISFPKIIKASATIARLMDDVAQIDEEVLPFTVQCFMKEYGMTLDDTSKKLHEMIEDAWKDINMECLSPTKLPRLLLENNINLSRMMETLYKKKDGYTNSTNIKDKITLLFVEPLQINL